MANYFDKSIEEAIALLLKVILIYAAVLRVGGFFGEKNNHGVVKFLNSICLGLRRTLKRSGFSLQQD